MPLTADGRFPCRPLVRPFLAGLAAAPRSLERIAALGGLEDGHPLEVTVAQERLVHLSVLLG